MGRNVFLRLFLRNELDPLEQIRFEVNFLRFAPNAPGRFNVRDYTDNIGFPFLTRDEISLASVGPYNVKQGDITNWTKSAIKFFCHSLVVTFPVPQIHWMT